MGRFVDVFNCLGNVLLIGLIATLVAVLVGVIMGALAGYYGGFIDDLLMRTTEMFQTIPSFVFAILLVAIMKPSIESVVIAIAVVSWPAVARLVRGEFLSLRNREFVQACHTVGMSDLRIMMGEILPNCLSPIIGPVAGWKRARMAARKLPGSAPAHRLMTI